MSKDWNYDRIKHAQAQIADAHNDMMLCLHRGAVNRNLRSRIEHRLRAAADEIALCAYDDAKDAK